MKKTKKLKINFWHFIKQQKLNITVYLIALAAASGLSVLSIFYTSKFIDAITRTAYSDGIKFLIYSTAAMVGTYTIYIFAWNFFYYFTQNIARDVRRTLVNRVFTLKSKTFSDNSAGIFISRITKDPDEAINGLDQLLDSFSHILQFTMTIIYICFLNLYLALMLLGSIMLMVILENWRTRLRIKHSTAQKRITDRNTSLTNEIVRSERDIKSLNLEDKLRKMAYDNYDAVRQAHMRTHRTGATLWSFRNICTFILTGVTLFVGIVLMRKGALTIAALMFVFINKDSLGSLIWQFGAMSQSIADTKVASARMFEIFDDEKYPIEAFGSLELENFKGEIEFKNVSFIYTDEQIKQDTYGDEIIKPKRKSKAAPTEAETETKKIQVLSNLNFKIEAGTTVAFAGKSGSGKSTILNLISKLYDSDDGEILLDGQNLNNLSHNAIRQNISLVNQFPYIFNASIRENLLMARHDATDEELWDACTQASLFEFIKGLSRGLDTRVGESGIKLSGGQRQRLAIARALLKKSKIILFDESTSSLDNQTQEDIKQSIASLIGGHTVVIVAHRLSTIKNCDKIFYLENGRIKDQGTYKELRSKNKDFEKFFTLEDAEKNED